MIQIVPMECICGSVENWADWFVIDEDALPAIWNNGRGVSGNRDELFKYWFEGHVHNSTEPRKRIK